APTGTISLSLANNASNGIEPSFAHHYSRNVIREGKKSKEKVEVYSYELLAYRALINANALPFSDDPQTRLPDYFVAADDIGPKQHVDIQAASQKWIDSSISKTANVPTDYPYEDFKDIYFYAYKQGLKGCTTFRFNPAAFQGVLVKEADLANTLYHFEPVRCLEGRVLRQVLTRIHEATTTARGEHLHVHRYRFRSERHRHAGRPCGAGRRRSGRRTRAGHAGRRAEEGSEEGRQEEGCAEEGRGQEARRQEGGSEEGSGQEEGCREEDGEEGRQEGREESREEGRHREEGGEEGREEGCRQGEESRQESRKEGQQQEDGEESRSQEDSQEGCREEGRQGGQEVHCQQEGACQGGEEA